jgi:hypothetical protein
MIQVKHMDDYFSWYLIANQAPDVMTWHSIMLLRNNPMHSSHMIKEAKAKYPKLCITPLHI